MKYLKLFMLFAVAAVFAACSDDDKSWNTNDATVAMANETISLKESKGLFNVPVSVTGDRNANVQVTVEVKEEAPNGAVEDKHYIVTSKTIIISPDQEVGNIEIKTVDDEEINDPRVFTVTIVDAQGAKVSEKATTTVTIKDNDAAFYDKLSGKWKMTSVNSKGAEQSWDVTVYVADEDEADYEKYIYVTGMMGYEWTTAVLEYNFDKTTKKVTLKWVLGTLFAEQVNFGLGGLNEVYLFGVVDGKLSAAADISGEVSSDLKSVEFTKDTPLYAAIFEQGGGAFTGYMWFNAYDIKMQR